MLSPFWWFCLPTTPMKREASLLVAIAGLQKPLLYRTAVVLTAENEKNFEQSVLLVSTRV